MLPEFTNSKTLSGLLPQINQTFGTTVAIFAAESNLRKIPPVTSCCESCSPEILRREFHSSINSAEGSFGGAESKPSVSPSKNIQCVIPLISLPILTIKSSPDRMPNIFGSSQSTASPNVIGTDSIEQFSIEDKEP